MLPQYGMVRFKIGGIIGPGFQGVNFTHIVYQHFYGNGHP